MVPRRPILRSPASPKPCPIHGPSKSGGSDSFLTVAVNSCAFDSQGAITSRDRASNWSLPRSRSLSNPNQYARIGNKRCLADGLMPTINSSEAIRRGTARPFAQEPVLQLASAKFSWTRLGPQSLWIHLASAAPPAKKVNHEMAPQRFFGRPRPKWRVEPSLPRTALERGTANPRKYARKKTPEQDNNNIQIQQAGFEPKHAYASP
jgi:hypothetical protein